MNAASKADLRRWFREGKAKGATHMIVVCDTFSYDDYPVYVKRGEDVREKVESYRKMEMSRVMEVYSFALSEESQVDTSAHVFNY